MNNLVLAYLGDAVYELYVREYLISQGISKVKDLQKQAINYVSAKAQCNVFERLQSENYFSESELDIIKRGRNAHSHQNKSVDVITYKKATGLETLIGYLYLNDKERLDKIMREVLK